MKKGKKIITFNNIFKKKKKIKVKKGFTLIELLAVIILLAIIVSITLVSFNYVKKNANEKAYKTNINNIQEVASSYLLENSGRLFFLNKDDDIEYQCVTVKNLIDYGYFDNDILSKSIGDNIFVKESDYVYLERDKSTGSINKSVFVNDSDLTGTCSEAVMALGDIYIVVNDKDVWTKNKDVTVYYKLSNLNDINNFKNYYGSYSYDGNNDEKVFSGYELNNMINIDKNNLNTKIIYRDDSDKVITEKDFVIEKIDNDGPLIEMVNNSYSDMVINSHDSVSFSFSISDLGSGLDEDSLDSDDFKIYIDDVLTSYKGNLVKDGDYYKLTINGVSTPGVLKIVIDKDSIADMIDNYNDGISFDTGVSVTNSYLVKYNVNGGNGSVNNITCEYGVDCNLASTGVSRVGYKFTGWGESTSSSGVYSINKSAGSLTNNEITLYAIWEPYKIYIRYNVNGGSLASSHGSQISLNNSYVVNSNITNRDNTYITVINYGNSLDSSGLYNANNSNLLNIERTGYGIVSGAEWCMNSSGSGTCFDQGTVYDASSFCDASSGDCVIDLFANWKIITYTLTLDQGSYSSITVNRTSSPIGGGSTGTLSSGSTIYYNDVLKITFKASNSSYSISTHTVNDTKFTSGNSYTVVGDTTVKSTATYNSTSSSTSSKASSSSSKASGSSSSATGGCFLAGTKVLTIDGYKDIDKLNENDKVLSYIESENKNVYSRVTKLIIHDDIKSYLYTLKINGKDFLVTEAHPIYVKRGLSKIWIRVDKLKLGDMVMDKDFNWYPITYINYIVIDDIVYNLEVEDNHNYYVSYDNILVHNALEKKTADKPGIG